ncbi:hypothetical protein [Acinetobacter bouvetii]|uniref:Lipoprotein n=1 Tax=Acinetobacter bouvetii TaxID=202951 RepID=A0A811G7Q3_9GAMM|nr:hypothetical protein [Acinetobacter bouvetii]CAB1211138.1 hypothetical protein SFB21_0906 [Acinetobacter bouvetii]
MKKPITILSLFMLSSCSFAEQNRPELEYNFSSCGQSILYGKTLIKICATRDFIAAEPRKRKKDWLAFLAAEGSSGYKGSRESVGGILEFQNQELNLQGYVWDFSKQGSPSLILRGHDSIIKNGTIINAKIYLGGGYRSPNFTTIKQETSTIDEMKFPYAKKDSFDKQSIENFSMENINFNGDLLYISSWNSGFLNSNLIS